MSPATGDIITGSDQGRTNIPASSATNWQIMCSWEAIQAGHEGSSSLPLLLLVMQLSHGVLCRDVHEALHLDSYLFCYFG